MDDHAAVADREDVDPSGHRTARRAEAPGQSADVATDVLRVVLLEYEPCREFVDKLVDALAGRVASHDLRFCIYEPHIFGIRPLDCCATGVRVPLQKISWRLARNNLLTPLFDCSVTQTSGFALGANAHVYSTSEPSRLVASVSTDAITGSGDSHPSQAAGAPAPDRCRINPDAPRFVVDTSRGTEPRRGAWPRNAPYSHLSRPAFTDSCPVPPSRSARLCSPHNSSGLRDVLLRKELR